MRVTSTPQSQAGPISHETLESWRAQKRSDATIADYMAQTNPSFAAQYNRIKQASGGDPRAATAFLNTRFYGDATYTPAPAPQKGFVGRILDRVWQNSVLDVGQALEDQQQGKQGAFDTGAQVASNLFTGALAPATETVRTGLGMAGKAVAGADQMLGGYGAKTLQQVGSDVANSQLGQAVGDVAQTVGTAYQNEREINPALRTLEGFSEAGMAATDALGVQQGARAATQLGQKAIELGPVVGQGAKSVAQKVPLVNRIPGLRPDKVDDVVGAAPQLAPLSPKAKQFTGIGGDERLARFIDQAKPSEKGMMRSMLERQAKASEDLTSTAQAKEVVGQHVMSQAQHLVKAKQEIGTRLGNVVNSVGDDVADLTDTYTQFVDDLMNKGISITSEGKIRNMSALPDEDIAYIQNVLKWMRPDRDGKVLRPIKDAHRYRQKLFAELNLAEARQKPFSQELEKFVDEAVRNRLMRDITRVHPQYGPLAQAYAKTISPLRNFLKQIGYRGTVDDVSEAGFESLRTGEVAMRSLGNASARPTQLLDELENAARQWGFTSDIKTQNLVRFADELENLFPIQQTRSLKGEVSRGVQDAVGLAAAPKAGLTRMAVDKVGEVVNNMRGMTPEARLKALRDLLNELPPSVADEIPGLMKSVDDFVDTASTNNVMREFKEARPLELKGGKKGTPGIDYPAEPNKKFADELFNKERAQVLEKGRTLTQADIDGLQDFQKPAVEGGKLRVWRSSNEPIKQGDFVAFSEQHAKSFADGRPMQSSLVRMEDIKTGGGQYVFSPQPQAQKSVSPLMAEARKYKSAEEFVKAQGTPLYRGQDAPSFSLDSSREKYLPNMKGTSFAKNADSARNYGDNLIEGYIPKGKILVSGDLPTDTVSNLKQKIRRLTYDDYVEGDGYENIVGEIVDLAEKNGKEAVDLTSFFPPSKIDAEIRVLDSSNAFKTKSQLTDIWKEANSQANQSTNALPSLNNLAKKFKTPEDFIKNLKNTSKRSAPKELVKELESIVPDDKGVTQFTNKLTDIWHEATGTPKPDPIVRGQPTPIPGTDLFVEDLPF